MESIFLPESKLNELAQSVSQRLLDAHDFDNGKIGGETLKSFASHDQINKFLIFQVFQVWDMQINKLNHPYFNLDGEEIQETLKVLKNQISQQIEISEEDFKPMLERAVYNNLRLVLSPKEAFSSFFFANNDSIPLDLYQRFSQFFSDLDFVVNSILKYYQKNQFEEVDKETFFEKMEKVLEIFDKKSDKNFSTYRSEIFDKLTGFSLEDIVQEVEVEKRWKEQEAADAARKAKEEEEALKAKEEEEARKKAEEEARLKAEEEAKRKEEEARKAAEEEARRKAEEEARLKAEEEAKKKEAEKMSFFDTLEEKDSFFDLDLEEEVAEAPTAEAPVEEEVKEVVEEAVTETVSEVVAEAETIADVIESPKVETPEPALSAEVESDKDFLEMAASMEPEAPVEEVVAETVVEEIIEETPVIEEPVVETAVSEPVETIEEKITDPVAEEIVEEVIEEVEEEIEEEVVEPVAETKAKGESTVSFLDRFLNKKETSNGSVEAPAVKEPEKPASVLDAISEKPKTIAEQYSQQSQQTQLHESINGNRKIKLDEIPIHKQYQYVQKVFEGNNVRFRIIVDKVNNAKNKDEVEDILNKFVLSNDAVDTKDEVVLEFIELLRKRF